MTTTDPRLTTRSYRQLCRLVLDRDLNLCQIHGPHCTRYATCVDHIIDRADGGDCYNPANLRAACRACNGWRSARRTNQIRYRTGIAHYDTRM